MCTNDTTSSFFAEYDGIYSQEGRRVGIPCVTYRSAIEFLKNNDCKNKKIYGLDNNGKFTKVLYDETKEVK